MQLELRQKMRDEKGDTYDLLCMGDVEFNDGWITKTEDSCPPTDISWKDIHEHFEGQASGQKKKRDIMLMLLTSFLNPFCTTLYF